MAEVITLSDSDDDVIAVPPQRLPIASRISVPARPPMTPRTMNGAANRASAAVAGTSATGAGGQATAHIGAVNKISLEQLGIRRLTDVYNKNQRLRSGEVEGEIRQSPAVASVRATGLRTQKRSSPVAMPAASSNYVPTTTASTSRTRANAANQAEFKYSGHYMFEATEGFDHNRRSTRNFKRIDGKFICSFNSAKCYVLCSGAVGTINHAWAHVVSDAPPLPAPKTIKRGDGFIYSDGSEIVLSDNSKLETRRMHTCPYCNALFQTAFQKTKHLTRCHLSREESPNSLCHICETDLESELVLRSHMLKHKPGESPYVCAKCKYRTSVRAFFYQHYIERHSTETLVCPICLQHFELVPTVRRQKRIEVTLFMNHMRDHAYGKQWRCGSCALQFNDESRWREHREKDHDPLTRTWNVVERTEIVINTRAVGSKKHRLQMAQKAFFETTEGKRINDEVACKDGAERLGHDTSAWGNTLHTCACGFQSYNGNRTASHFHKCRQLIVSRDHDRERPVRDEDPSEELILFNVYPPLSHSEIETKAIEEENRRKIVIDQTNDIMKDLVYQPQQDLRLLKMLAELVPRASEIIDECAANVSEPF
ncbi:unnamed protein product [Caenorhabditis sp. 36 PRJEB53466]|nr:unnamed protein product [Caenorhabditis sp. 36 PRJEB53466]